MNQTDVYYRALLGYRREVEAHPACARDTRLYADAGGRGSITVKRALCTVDETWIKAIEDGLVHIEKAIRQERQFIYSNGEVVPIEKVKNISRESVQHLARHSELLTRAPEEGADIIPDSLYTVERLSDYAVYENRFLYMLLCYLRDFVTLRYQNILDLTNRYEGVLSVERNIQSLNREINLTIELDEVRRDDPYLRDHNPALPLIQRMDLILKTIIAFLGTPLMESASKVAMLKPPITKTNVLKMNNDFKGAVELYDYIISYEGPGYTVEENEFIIDPFRDSLSEDMAEAERLLSFLTYRYGLDLGADLKAAYELEEARRREEELRQRTEQMASVRRRLEAEGQPIEAYILYLERQVRALQNEVDRIPGILEELEEHTAHEARLAEEVDTLTTSLHELEEVHRAAEIAHAVELRETVENYERQMAEQREAHAAELRRMEEQHEAAMADLRAEYEERLRVMQETHDAEMASVREAHAAEIDALNEQHAASVAVMQEAHAHEVTSLREAHTHEVTSLRDSLNTTEENLAVRTRENQALLEDGQRLRAMVLSLRSAQGQISATELDEMTHEDSFDELERELEAFIRFYETQWTRTKRAIRKDLLNPKSIKRQSAKK